MAQTKITVKILESLLDDFDGHLRRLHLKRDAFIDHVIGIELDHLERDLQGKSLSPRVRQHISRNLKRMGTTQVNLVIDASNAERLRVIVKQTNIVRDAFINRLIYLLHASDSLLDYLELPRAAESQAGVHFASSIPISPIRAIAVAHADPMAALRHAVDKQFGIGLYSIKLPDELAAFACYLEESDLPVDLKLADMHTDVNPNSSKLSALEVLIYGTPSQRKK